jgi:glycosidase
MGFVQDTLAAKRPESVRAVALPRRISSFASPADWRDEVIYFLLPDRFSDTRTDRPMLKPANRTAFRPAGFRFDRWAESGGGRYQGGSIAGITLRLPYLKGLGVSTLWVGPVFKQRAERNDFHGYAIQDFLEVDPRLGDRNDLVALVQAAHGQNMRVLLDVVFNHTGNNWIYADGQDRPPYLTWPGFYPKGQWRSGTGQLTGSVGSDDDGVWPRELQANDGYYTRAGEGNLGAGSIEDPHAEFRRTDFVGDRDINYDAADALSDLARCYKYWIALTDCDGLRLDTLKHVDDNAARTFCGSIKEFAANLGKKNFFLVGEVAGANTDADRYLRVLGANLSATLDIAEIRPALTGVAKGLMPPSVYFDMVRPWDDDLGSHRDAGLHRVSILDDHDHVSGDKVRFSADAKPADRQVVAGVALQLFGVGIPCIYYGTEQAFAGPEKSLRDQFLPDWNRGNPPPDKFLREAMFGPEHPRLDGRAGIGASPASDDQTLPGFGPFGTAGAHCFDSSSAAYVRIAALISVRRDFPVLRYGRQYQRPISKSQQEFGFPAAGELIAWSRLLDDEEALCVVNGNGADAQGGDVLIDSSLNGPAATMTVKANSAQAGAGAGYAGPHPVGQALPVLRRNGSAFVEIRGLPPAEVLVLVNKP